MKKILFIGACDKSEILLYLAKILTQAEQRVLIIDGTTLQKYQYSVPEFKNNNLLTEYDGFDVATGFGHDQNTVSLKDELEACLNKTNESESQYNYILIDSDNVNTLIWDEITHHVLVTNTDRYTLTNNTELLKSYFEHMENTLIPFTKIHYPYFSTNIDDSYMDSTVSRFPIEWNEERDFEIEFDEVDHAWKINLQYESRITLKRLSRALKSNLLTLAKTLTDIDPSILKDAIKKSERGK